MSKTVTIPSGDNPFIAKINDKYYSYPAGTTVEVPDAVAALIGSIEGNDPPATIPAAPDMPRGGAVNDVLTRTSDGAEWKAPATPEPELPAVSGTDNGKVLKVVEGAWAAASGSSGGDSLKISFNENSVADTTWQQAYDALVAGKRVYSILADDDLAEQIIWSSAQDAGEVLYLYGLYAEDVLGAQVCQADSADGYLYYDI